MVAKEYSLNNINTYKYCMFYNEINSGYYITDNTIDKIIKSIDWECTKLEIKYLQYWREFEHMQKKYCIGEIDKEYYIKEVKNKMKKYEIETGYEYTNSAEKIESHILNELHGVTPKK